MVLLTTLNKLSSSLTKTIGPPLFRTGLSLRNKLVPRNPNTINNYWIDMLFLIPYSQKLLSLAIYEETKVQIDSFRRQRFDAMAATDFYNDKDDRHDKEVQDLQTTLRNATVDASATVQMAEIRTKVLNDILRPSLLPTETWGNDIENSWRYNIRLVAWIRKEILLAKYGPFIQEAMMAYPSLRMSPQFQSSNRRRFFIDLMNRGIIQWDQKNNTSTDNSPYDESLATIQRLPRTNVVVKALRMRDWSTQKNSARFRQAVLPLVTKLGGTEYQSPLDDDEEDALVQKTKNTGTTSGHLAVSKPGTFSFTHAMIPPETKLDDTSLDDLLEVVTGGYINNCGPLNALCQEANCYQLWTREYVEHLGDYLLRRIESSNCCESTVILDVGAGDGLLIQCLKEYMYDKMMTSKPKAGKTGLTVKTDHEIIVAKRGMPKLIATDDMSWNIFTKANVEKLSVDQALQTYAQATKRTTKDTLSDESNREDPPENQSRSGQVIVLCSWMPMGEDWSAKFREAGVDEYILIGESDDGSCGHNWWTWGNSAFRDGTIKSSKDMPSVAPFIQDGYERRDLKELTSYQFSSFDCAISKSSNTVSFRKLQD
ncbi:hypothetical protein IV203_010065 [Nitzschia inconspicua]|uniref:Uncharacterized protein n=1 Tax=Nitzschia inconspicua TaxID=303405 RepID=A0A9K3KVF7_9STRA|nr:hypothetical protein IV203_010065 [Nitzschia inconspicua]